jgi:hypothetical protein
MIAALAVIGVAALVVVAAFEAATSSKSGAFEGEPAADTPLPGIGRQAWRRWQDGNRLPAAAAERHADRTPHYGLRARELEDVELPRPRTEFDEEEAFADVSRRLLDDVRRQFGDLVGRVLEGQPATLSGLMAVARYAGLGGLPGWAEQADERQHFTETTAAFRRCNGIF